MIDTKTLKRWIHNKYHNVRDLKVCHAGKLFPHIKIEYKGNISPKILHHFLVSRLPDTDFIVKQYFNTMEQAKKFTCNLLDEYSVRKPFKYGNKWIFNKNNEKYYVVICNEFKELPKNTYVALKFEKDKLVVDYPNIERKEIKLSDLSSSVIFKIIVK